jgi:hypothetical protein
VAGVTGEISSFGLPGVRTGGANAVAGLEEKPVLAVPRLVGMM